MFGPTVTIPGSILQHQELNPAQKRLWAILATQRLKRVDELAEVTGRSRDTVYRHLLELEKCEVLHRQRSGDHTYEFKLSAPEAEWGCDVPVELVLGLSGEALLIWVALARGTSASLKGVATFTGLDRRTVKKHLRLLREADWVRGAEVCNPLEEERHADIVLLKQRLFELQRNEGLSYGQALMTAFLTLIVADDNYRIEAAEPFLVNPFGSEPLRYDLYWPRYQIAFEFHGPQHFYPTRQYPSLGSFRLQRLRDIFKRGVSADQGVRLWILTCEQLTLSQLVEMTAGLPQRDPRGKEHVIAHLEAVARRHGRRLGRIPAVTALP